MAGLATPDLKADRDTLVAHQARKPLVLFTALIPYPGGEDVRIVTKTVEKPGIVEVGKVVEGEVEVGVLVVITVEELLGIEDSPHREHRGEDVRMAESKIDRMIAAEAATDRRQTGRAVLSVD